MADNVPADAFERMLEDMKPLFWDADIEALDRERHAGYIISRLLNYGGMRGYIWVVDLFSEGQIVDAVCNRREIRPVVRSFMAGKYAIPEERLMRAQEWR